MIRKALAAPALAGAAAIVLTAGTASAQTFTTSSLVGLACDHKSALVYLLTAFGVGSVLGWFKHRLPAPIAHAANLAALNWDELVPVAKALWAALKTPVCTAAVKMLAIAVIGTMALSACTKQAAQNLQATAQAAQTASVAVAQATATTINGVQQVVQTLQPVNAQLACLVQAQANLATDALTQTHNTAAAAESSTVSKVAGTFCNGLAAGAPLPNPVPVTGTPTAVQVTGVGIVALPTPAAAAK